MSSTLSNIVVRITFQCDITNAGLDGEVEHTPTDQRPLIGTQTGRANVVFNDDLNLQANVNYDLDFTSIYDPAGIVHTWVHMLDLVIEHRGGPQSISIGGGTSGLFTTLPLPLNPGAATVPLYDLNYGLSVGGTNRVLRLFSTGTATARVSAIGRTT